MTYEFSDSNGVKQTTAWSKAVRKAMVRGGAEYQVQEAMNRAVTNWGKTFLRDTNAGLRNISQAASMGVQSRCWLVLSLLHACFSSRFFEHDMEQLKHIADTLGGEQAKEIREEILPKYEALLAKIPPLHDLQRYIVS
jgi:hypothetical protein